MNIPYTLPTAAALAAAMVMASTPAVAQSTWTGGGADDNFTTAGNWDTPPTNPVGAGLIFAGSTRTTPNADAAFTGIDSISFTGATAAFTLGGSSLTFTDGATLTNPTGLAHTINNTVIAAADGTFTVDAAGGNLTLGGGVDLSGGAGAALAVIGANNTTLAGVVSGAGGSIDKSGAGTLTLSGANTFTGGVTLSAGTLAIGNNTALGTGTLTASGGTLTASGGARTVANDLALTGDITAAGTNSLTVTGATDLGGARALNVTAIQPFTLAGVVSNGSITKNGTGTLGLSGANTFAGGVTLNDGTLQLGSDAALGTGTLTLNSGTLEAAGGARSLTNAVAVAGNFQLQSTNDLTLSGATDLGGATRTVTVQNAGGDLILSGVVSNGGITLSGGGGLTLSGANTFTGPVTVDSGTLTLAGGSALDDAVALSTADAASAQVVLAANETVASIAGGGGSGGNIDAGANTLTLAGAADTTFAGAITNGSLTRAGTGTTTLSSSGTNLTNLAITSGGVRVTGNVTITTVDLTGGSLVNNGAIGGNVNVGAAYSGSGTIGGNLTGNNGGTIAPGNSIGSVIVGGNFVLNAGAFLDVEVDGASTATDVVAATGTATLAAGSTIRVDPSLNLDSITDGQQWTIVTSSGLTNDATIASLEPTVVFDASASTANNLILTATVLSMTEAFGSSNAAAVITALEADAGGDAGLQTLLTNLNALSGGPLQNAAQSLTPEQFDAVQLASLQHAVGYNHTVANYLAGRRAGLAGLAGQAAAQPNPSFAALAAADPRTFAAYLDQPTDAEAAGAGDAEAADPDGGAAAPRPQAPALHRPFTAENLSAFGVAYGVFQDRDAAPNQIGFQADSAAAQIGVDYALSDNLLIGLGFGYAYTDVDFNGSRGSGDINTIRVGPYASYQRDRYFLDASVTYGYHDNDFDRNAVGLGQTLSADYDAHDVSAYLGGGYSIPVRQFVITPRGSLQYTYYDADGYTETGGSAAVTVGSQEFQSLRSLLGATASTRVAVDNITLVPEVTLGWVHEFLQDGESINGRFTAGATPFSITTADADNNALLVGAGVSALLRQDLAVSLRYEGEFASDTDTHNVFASVTLRF